MAQVLVTESYLDDIAYAIREKNGTETTYKPLQMAAAIEALPDPSVLDSKSITANGTYDPSDDNLDGYDEVTVNVPNSYAAGDEGKVVSNGALVAQTSQNISENGTYDTTLNNEVVVNVDGGSGGGGQGVIIDPSFQGLAYFYVARNGEIIYGQDTKTQSINIFVVKANHKYVLFVDEIGTRRRCGFFPNITLNDIIYEANNAHQIDSELHSNGTWLAPFEKGTDDSGNFLYGRIIYTPEANGLIIFGTSNDGTIVPAYCVDMTQYA